MTMLTPAARGAEPRLVTSVEGISEYELENGLKILLFPDPSKSQVTVNLTVFVGSRHEGYGEAGMAHLLEHMLFKGTPTFPQIPKVLKDHGADFNGTTSLDRTNYYETLPASDANLEFAITLEADRMVNSYVKGEDLATEMTVVRNEFERGENSPRGILDQRVMSAAYEWHNYGKSTIGNRADIERVPIESLQRFYKKYYQPDNAMLIVAGAFDPEFALKLIQEKFGAIPRPERVLDQTYTEEPAQDGERLVTLRRVGDVGLAEAVYHIPSGASPEYPAIDCLAYILTSTPSGRLYKALVETKLASRVSGYADSLHDPGVLKAMAEAAPGVEPRDLLGKMLEVIESTGEQGVTEEEVERAKRYWMKIWEMSLTDSAGLARYLSEWAAQGDWRLMFLYRDRLEQVTVESVNAAARQYLRQNNRTAGIFIPTKVPERVSVPKTPDLAEMIGDYKGREVVAAGEAFDVSYENIEQRTQRVILPSGVKAAFLPKKTRAEAVVVRLSLRYGTAESLQGLALACEALPHLMLRGTKQLTRQQIQDELDKSKTQLTVPFQGASAGNAVFEMVTRREHLPAALELLRQVVREATLPAAELELIRTQRLSSYEQQLSDPSALAQNGLSRALNAAYPPNDVRYVASPAEELERWKALQRDSVVRLYDNFLGGNYGEVVVIGDFETAEIQPLVEKIFSNWSAKEVFAHIPRTGNVAVRSNHEEIRTPDKENATLMAGSVFPMLDNNPDYPGLIIGNFVLGHSGLSSRLGDRVRQKEGLSYGVGSVVRSSALDQRTTFLMYAIFNPTNTTKVETAIQEEVALLLKEGITEEELQAAKKGYLEGQLIERNDDSYIASLLTSSLYLNRDLLFYSTRDQQIQQLTVAQVGETMRKWIDPSKIVTVVAGDFKKE
ncbi:M16 family metallopeptidase [Planctomicrobium sp. SH664]|uniref:M16 family metallopeptidase n=1 Tax=Planctomicrobium sp. SH664 TaxID=3448125 RepID=UPI003F5B0F34